MRQSLLTVLLTLVLISPSSFAEDSNSNADPDTAAEHTVGENDEPATGVRRRRTPRPVPNPATKLHNVPNDVLFCLNKDNELEAIERLKELGKRGQLEVFVQKNGFNPVYTFLQTIPGPLVSRPGLRPGRMRFQHKRFTVTMKTGWDGWFPNGKCEVSKVETGKPYMTPGPIDEPIADTAEAGQLVDLHSLPIDLLQCGDEERNMISSLMGLQKSTDELGQTRYSIQKVKTDEHETLYVFNKRSEDHSTRRDKEAPQKGHFTVRVQHYGGEPQCDFEASASTDDIRHEKKKGTLTGRVSRYFNFGTTTPNGGNGFPGNLLSPWMPTVIPSTPFEGQLHIYKGRFKSPPSALHPLIGGTVIITNTDKNGMYSVDLEEGNWSVFPLIDGELRSSFKDNDGYVNAVKIKSGEEKRRNIRIPYRLNFGFGGLE